MKQHGLLMKHLASVGVKGKAKVWGETRQERKQSPAQENSLRSRRNMALAEGLEAGGGVPVVAQWLTNPTRNMRLQVQSLPLLNGLTIRCCHELWYRS